MTKADILAVTTPAALKDALSFTLDAEGVYYEEEDSDPGGATYAGVTHYDFSAWLKEHGKPDRPVKTITTAEVFAVYRDHYWAPLRASALPPPVGFVLFDSAVNVGSGRAVPWLCKTMGVPSTGSGVTLSVVAAAQTYADKHGSESLAGAILARRVAYYNALAADHPALHKFLAGWLARCTNLKSAAGIP